jgi:hypothetical protein
VGKKWNNDASPGGAKEAAYYALSVIAPLSAAPQNSRDWRFLQPPLKPKTSPSAAQAQFSESYNPCLPMAAPDNGRELKDCRIGTPSGKIQVSFQLVIAVAYLWLCWHFPGPGKALLWLTVSAVLMTVSGTGPSHKAVWLLLVFALMFLENKSIDKDRAENANLAKRQIEMASEGLAGVRSVDQDIRLVDIKIGQMLALQREINSAETNPKDNQKLLMSLQEQMTLREQELSALSQKLEVIPKQNPTPAPSQSQSQIRQNPPAQLHVSPIILSAPLGFHDGEITGKDFGANRGAVYVHPHLRDATSPNTDNLLSNSTPGNYVELDKSMIATWEDTRIELKIPLDFWTGLMARIGEKATERHVPAPSPGTIAFCFQVKRPDWEPTSCFYQH